MTFFPERASAPYPYWPPYSGYGGATSPPMATPPGYGPLSPYYGAYGFATPRDVYAPAAMPFPMRDFRPALPHVAPTSAKPNLRAPLPAPPSPPKVVAGPVAAPARHRTPAGLKPLDWNLSLLIPPLGIASALGWGVSSIYEHQLQAGHALKLPFLKTSPAMARRLTTLAAKAPIINVVYGALNAVGAIAQGYSMRGVAFGAFTLFSAALMPRMLKNNQQVVQMAKKLAELPKNPALKAEIETMARKGLKLHDISSLYNAIAPIGLLTGLFSITKVAQSTPGKFVEHPHGDTLRQMQDEAPPGRSLLEVLRRNARQELGSFVQTAAHSWRHFVDAIGDFGQAFRNLVDPPERLRDQSAFARFMDPITSGMAVPLFYSHATLGRVLYSTLAAGMFIGLGGAAIRSKSIYDAALKAVGKTAQAAPEKAQKLNKALSGLLVWGNFSGTPAGLFTRFGDWPLALSSAYRTSGFAYGASALSSALKMAGVQKLGKFYREGQVFGFDERALTKIGAFIQGTSYFVNLLLKNLSGSSAAAASTGVRLGESEPGAVAWTAH